MKKKLVVGIVGLLILTMLVVIPLQIASADTVVATCKGKLIIAGPPKIGIVTYPDGNYHVRGQVIVYQTVFPDCDIPLDGPNTITANLNWDSDDFEEASGRSWGTFDKVVSYYEDTGFAGTFTADKYPNGYAGKMRGLGYGELEGYRVMGEMEFTGNPYYGNIEVTVSE